MSARSTHSTLVEAYLLLDDGDHQILSQFGLTPTQFAVLKLLDLGRGQRASDLTGTLLLEKSSVSRLIDRLVEQQLVRRVSDPDDRRSQRIVLTPAGLARREQASAAHEASLEERLAGLDELERQQLIGLLDKLRSQLRASLRRDS